MTLLATLVLAAPTRAATCGNNVLEEGEECDQSDFGGLSCDDFCAAGSQLPPPGLRCRSDCTIDTSPCYLCGNNRIDVANNEVCDGTDLGGHSCIQSGVLRCAPDCTHFDYSGCFGCGNGVREGTEQCDGNDLGGATCNGAGETGGTPACTGANDPLGRPACQVDHTPCWKCGNGRVDPNEDCDDGTLNGTPGDPCSTKCTKLCGNGIRETGEECDDGASNGTSNDGCGPTCHMSAQFEGGGAEAWDCDAKWTVAGVAQSATPTCQAGDPSCDRGHVAGACTFKVTLCLAVYPGLSGSPFCVPGHITRVALAGASLAGPTALEPTAQTRVLTDIQARINAGTGSSGARTGSGIDVSPKLTQTNVCGPTTIVVPAGAARDLAVETTDDLGHVDFDELFFNCTW
jgi:cysteine-rich repeat protein